MVLAKHKSLDNAREKRSFAIRHSEKNLGLKSFFMWGYYLLHVGALSRVFGMDFASYSPRIYI